MGLLSIVRGLAIPTLVVACLAFYYGYNSYTADADSPPLCPSHGGSTHPAFQEVKKAFIETISKKGGYRGAALSVYYKGEPLVDLWGGCADQRTSKAWSENTVTQAWSTTKGVTAIALAHLIDNARLDPKQKVAHYWPEFAQNGKEDVTVATLLSHQAGVSNLERPISLKEYRDNWPMVEAMMAKQEPVWKPGTTYMYHSLTWGLYADALIRKVDKKQRNATQYFKDEIAGPFGVDFHIGLPKNQFHRSAFAIYPPMWHIYAEFILKAPSWKTMYEAVRNMDKSVTASKAVNFFDDVPSLNGAEARSIGLPSSHGYGSARGLAKLFDYLANGGTIKGKTLLSPKAISFLSTPRDRSVPAMVPPGMTFTSLGLMEERNRNGGYTYGHRGYGGQHGYADMKHKVGVAYLTNYNRGMGMPDDPRMSKVLEVLYRCLQEFQQ